MRGNRNPGAPARTPGGGSGRACLAAAGAGLLAGCEALGVTVDLAVAFKILFVAVPAAAVIAWLLYERGTRDAEREIRRGGPRGRSARPQVPPAEAEPTDPDVLRDREGRGRDEREGGTRA